MESVKYNWRVLLQTAVGEPNTRVVEELVYDIEEAMYVRWQELARGPADKAELQALKAAADDLLAIKVHKLGWPDPLRDIARLDITDSCEAKEIATATFRSAARLLQLQ